jgi:hypothetical protein
VHYNDSDIFSDNNCQNHIIGNEMIYKRGVTIQPTNFPITNHTTNLLIIPLNSKFSPIIARSLYNGYKYVINK